MNLKKKKESILEVERLVKSTQFSLLARGQSGLPSTVAQKGEAWDESYDPIWGVTEGQSQGLAISTSPWNGNEVDAQ